MAADKIILTCAVGVDIQSALKAAADDQYTTTSTILRQALVSYLRRYNYLEPRSLEEQSKAVHEEVSKVIAKLGWRDDK